MPNQLIAVLACAVIFISLCVGGYTDSKTRTIPNAVPLVILVCGFFTATPAAYKLFSVCAMAFALFVSSRMTALKSGGGDVKVYLSLSFAVGLFAMLPILIMLAIAPPLWGFLLRTKHEGRTRFPAITFIGPIYAIWFLCSQLMTIGG